MSKVICISAWILLTFCYNAFASMLDDLASPSQTARDEAAASLRKSYQPISKTKWESEFERIKIGGTKADMLTLIHPVPSQGHGGAGSGQSHSESYRLDDEWIVTVWLENDSLKLISKDLSWNMRSIWIAPPKDFSGKWVTYFVNGQKSDEIEYKDGSYGGELRAFRSDGSLVFEQRYLPGGVIDGEDTGFHPSGKVMYKAYYKLGKPVGTWIWYDEDGKVTSTLERPDK